MKQRRPAGDAEHHTRDGRDGCAPRNYQLYQLGSACISLYDDGFNLSARDTIADLPCHVSRSGELSGRQRRHGRKPAFCAAAAVGTKQQFSSFGGRWADRTAINTGRLNAREESPIVTNVTRANRPITYCGIKLHPLTVGHASDAVWRFSDAVCRFAATPLPNAK
jgi:hypothetical protein